MTIKIEEKKILNKNKIIYVGLQFSDWAHGWMGFRLNGPIIMNL